MSIVSEVPVLTDVDYFVQALFSKVQRLYFR